MSEADTAGPHLPTSTANGCSHVAQLQKRRAQLPNRLIKSPKYLFIASFFPAGGEEADFRISLEAQKSLRQPEFLHGHVDYDKPSCPVLLRAKTNFLLVLCMLL